MPKDKIHHIWILRDLITFYFWHPLVVPLEAEHCPLSDFNGSVTAVSTFPSPVICQWGGGNRTGRFTEIPDVITQG